MNPEDSIYCLMALAGTAYVVLGGADFGTGIWEFNNAFNVDDAERELTTRAMGPVWEANHVWLIFLFTLFFTCFPLAFSALTQGLWIPLLLAAVGIVCRGSSFVLRAYTPGIRQQKAWGIVFACSSTFAPLFLGIAVGTVASASLTFDATGQFTGNFLHSWLTPLGIFSGFFSVSISAYLAAVYLTRDAAREGNVRLTEVWRRRALASGKWSGILAFAGVAMVATSSSMLWFGFKNAAVFFVACSAAGGFVSYLCLFKRMYTVAALAAVIAVSSVMLGWAWAQYPWLLPEHFSLRNAKAPEIVLQLVLGVVASGAAILIPSLWYLLYVFKLGKQQQD